MPPALNADHRDIVIAKTDPASYDYRLRVARYRKIERTAECGVHINLGLSERGLKALGLDDSPALVETRNRLYLTAAVGFYQYRWLLTTLFGATPVTFANYFSAATDAPSQPVRSLRNSPFGYGNGVAGSYESVAAYVARIETAVAEGDLLADREFYGIVRLKGGAELADLLTDGVRYIELRTLDLDPFEPLGISGQTLDFIRLLFGYFILQTALPTQINAAVANGEAANRVAALESPFAPSHMLQQGLDLLADLQAFYDGVALPFNAQTLIDQMRERLLNPALTPAARLAKMAADHQLFETLKQTTQHYQQDLTNRPLIGFESRTSVDQRQILAELQAGRAVALPEAQKLNE
ncbi:glutamate--cysteine ligase [Secundilactobacillus kimchicus]|nr:glutamate--cysteine ligase [Secundilactobacillus kimchicus]